MQPMQEFLIKNQEFKIQHYQDVEKIDVSIHTYALAYKFVVKITIHCHHFQVWYKDLD